MVKKFLCIDVGGTQIKHALLTAQGEIITKDKIATPQTDLPTFVAAIQRIIDSYAQQYQGIAFSTPGKVDHKDERIYGGGLLGFLDQQAFSELLHVDQDIPIAVENDAKAAVLAEMWLGNLREVDNGVALVLGSGVGSGIVLNRQLLTGSHFQAGEVSFMFPHASADFKQMAGADCSAVAMIKDVAQALHLADLTDGLAVFAQINARQPVAWEIFENYCLNVALLIHNMQMVLDVERFVIGGGISAQPIVTQTIAESLQQLRTRLAPIDTLFTMPEIKTMHFHNDANLYGALYHLLQNNPNLN